jgi:CDP-paratose 2-epimerase
VASVFITGGAGFIGCAVACHHLSKGDSVIVFDNLSRKGTPHNLEWLRSHANGGLLTFVKGDIRDAQALEESITSETDIVYHLAAQVAVTTSVVEPREDFEINALGTFNVLEAVRRKSPSAIVFYSSTNKVYGGLEDRAVEETDTRYLLADRPLGISETEPLDFHSPYGCSKGCGDQYVRDYARMYGLRTVVFRQSCIYGTRQFGVEDQGWVAHFCLATRFGRPLMIYGDGKQVRDLLYIDDLVAAYEAAAANIDVTAGQVYNIGGGPDCSLSIWKEFGPALERISGGLPEVGVGDWRPGDQPIYVSDIRKAKQDFGWAPRVSTEDGLARLWAWIGENESLLRDTFGSHS